MEQVLRRIMEQQCCELLPVEEILTELGFVPLRRASLSRVKVGMYWYDDDTVSSHLSAKKKLKSLVLFVENGAVYGDSFRQHYLVGNKVDAFVESLQNEYAQAYGSGIICRPKVDDLQKVYKNFDLVNTRLKQINHLKWSDNLFWGEKSDDSFVSVVDLIDGSITRMSSKEGAYIRPMIVFSVF